MRLAAHLVGAVALAVAAFAPGALALQVGGASLAAQRGAGAHSLQPSSSSPSLLELSQEQSADLSAEQSVSHSTLSVELLHDELSPSRAGAFVASLRDAQRLPRGGHSSLLEVDDANNTTAPAGAAPAGVPVFGYGIPLHQEVLRNRHIASYYGLVTVGGHEFRVMFDTGSCEFWIPSTQCTSQRCMRHRRYPVETLPRFKAAADSDAVVATGARFAQAQLNISYISGRVTGPMVHDRVAVGPIVIPDQMVGVARTVDVNLLDDVVWDGIMGLAFPHRSVLARGVIPVFENIMNKNVLTERGLRNQFAYHVGGKGGSFTLGGADCSAVRAAPGPECFNKFAFAPVSRPEYWTVDLEDVWATMPDGTVKKDLCGGSGRPGRPAACRAIVDTGTYLVYGPSNTVRQVLPAVFARCHDQGLLPKLTFRVKTGPRSAPLELTIAPEDYVLKFNVDDAAAAKAAPPAPGAPLPTKEECVLGVAPDRDATWTLGQVFLRSYYALFDREHQRIGFARLPGTEFKPIALTEVATEVAAKAQITTAVETEAETEVDAEAETEVDAEAEAEAEAETEVDAEAEEEQEQEEEGEAYTEAEAETETEHETEAENESEVDAEAEAETEVESETSEE